MGRGAGLGDGGVSARGTTAWRGGGGGGGGGRLIGGGIGGGLHFAGGGGGGAFAAGLGEGLGERGAGATGFSVAVWPCAVAVGVPAGTGRGVLGTPESRGGGGEHAHGHIFGEEGAEEESGRTTGAAGAPAGTAPAGAAVGAFVVVTGAAVGPGVGAGMGRTTGPPETAGRVAAAPREPTVPLMTPLKPAMKKPPTPEALPSVAMMTSCACGVGSGVFGGARVFGCRVWGQDKRPGA